MWINLEEFELDFEDESFFYLELDMWDRTTASLPVEIGLKVGSDNQTSSGSWVDHRGTEGTI